jgi:hypothetical protein
MSNINLIVGNKYNYYDTEDSIPCPCELLEIRNKEIYTVYIFKHDNSTGTGASIYSHKFKSRLKDDRKAKLEKLKYKQ